MFFDSFNHVGNGNRNETERLEVRKTPHFLFWIFHVSGVQLNIQSLYFEELSLPSLTQKITNKSSCFVDFSMCQVLKNRLKSEDGKAEKDDNLSESARKAVDKVAGVKRRQLKAGSCDKCFFLMLQFLISDPGIYMNLQ